MPLARLERTRRAYQMGDLHRENRDGWLVGDTWHPLNIRGGVDITDGPKQAAREAGAKFIWWNDGLWTVQPCNPIDLEAQLERFH